MRVATLFIFLFILTACKTESQPDRPALADQVTIYRDTWGIPHVMGETDAATVFGLAYAYAEDRFPEIEKATINTLGKGPEVYGVKDSTDLLNAVYFHAFEIEKRAKSQYKNLSPPYQAIVDAFADGLNYYLKSHPEEEVKYIRNFEPWYILAAELRGEEDYWINGYMGVKPVDPSVLKRVKNHTIGSNGWALAPSKTKSGNAMLLVNPHDSQNTPHYECHIQSREGLDFYGIMPHDMLTSLPGLGFNKHLGYTHTINNKDVQDAYEITFDHPDDPMKYRFGDRYKTAEALVFEITIKAGDSFSKQKFQIKKTIHGPVFNNAEGKDISYRLAQNTTVTLMEQKYGMIKASNWEEYRKAVALNAKIHHNIIYADDVGNIYYLFNGRVPIRDQSYDWSQPVPGSDPKTLWHDYHSIDELPQVFNPECGYVQNCNQSPFYTTTTENPDPSQFPDYMTYLNATDENRAQRSRTLLDSAKNVTLSSLHKLNFDTYMEGLSPFIDTLKQEWKGIENSDPKRYKALEEAVNMMLAWDLYSGKESIPTGITTAWSDAYSLAFDPENPGNLPKQLDLFEKGLQLLSVEFETWKVPYGQLLRVQRSSSEAYGVDPILPSYATDGNVGFLGTMFCMEPNVYNGESLVRRIGFGNSFVAHVEFTPEGPVANSLLSYGNSSRPDSPHYNDQTEMFAKGEMKKVNFTMEDIMNNLESQYKPGEEINTQPSTK